MSTCVYYFSGTGNTAHAALTLTRELQRLGLNVILKNIELYPEPEAAENEVFLFPVYAFVMPEIFSSYLKMLPSSGAPASVLAVLGAMKGVPGEEGYALTEAVRLLRRKGREVRLTDILNYPESFTAVIPPPDEETSVELTTRAAQRVRELARDIYAGKITLRPKNILGRWLSAITGFLFKHLGRRGLGKTYVADPDCNGCGVCAKICPAKAIELEGGLPRWNLRCQACQRCINFCPRSAIQTSPLRFLLSIALLFPSYQSRMGLNLPLPAALIFNLACAILLFLVIDSLLWQIEKRPGTPLARLLSRSYTKTFRRYQPPLTR